MKTVSKDLAIKLRENGYPQENHAYYYDIYHIGKADEIVELYPQKQGENEHFNSFASPSADEILDLLPKERYYTCVKTNTDRWRIAEFDQDGLAEEGKTSFIAESLADACALMYIFLKEQSLISQKEKMK